MHHHLSKKRLDDRARFARWSHLTNSTDALLGKAQAQWQALQLKLRGHIVLPGEAAYDASRKLYNPAFNPFPVAIVYCAVEDDVRWALEFVTVEKLPFVVRSGGHTTAGYSSMTARVVIDVSGLNDVVVVPEQRLAYVGCGANFGKLNAALSPFSLHVPGGECEDVCIGGYMQGGGYGFTSPMFGMNCDRVVQVRVMLATGRVVTASASENMDLWWAVRGGTGGNFGILLQVVYQLAPIGSVWGWSLAWPMATPQDRVNTAQALMVLQANYMKGAPAKLSSQIMISYQNDASGQNPSPWMSVRGMYLGSATEGAAAIAPLTQLPGVVQQYTMTGSYVELNDYLLDHPQSLVPFPPDVHGMPPEDKQARFVSQDLTQAQWLDLLNFFVTSPNPWSYMCLEIYGGAINRYPIEDSAFIHRNCAFSAFLDVFWLSESEREPSERFLKAWCDWWTPVWNGGIYQNYPSPDVPDYRSNYWGMAFPALLAVKNKYDPLGAFEFPQAIRAGTQTQQVVPSWPPKVMAQLPEPIH